MHKAQLRLGEPQRTMNDERRPRQRWQNHKTPTPSKAAETTLPKRVKVLPTRHYFLLNEDRWHNSRIRQPRKRINKPEAKSSLHLSDSDAQQLLSEPYLKIFVTVSIGARLILP